MVSFTMHLKISYLQPSARLCHMLSLQRLDAEGPFGGKKLLPTSKDWIELEERRRTFWASYYGDRWSSCATGWPMMFDEDKVGMDFVDEA